MMNASLFDEGLFGDEMVEKPSVVAKKKRASRTKKAVESSSSGSDVVASSVFDAKALWQSCLDELKSTTPEMEFNQWLRPLKPAIEDGQLVLFAINAVYIHKVNEKYLDIINQILSIHTQRLLTARVQVKVLTPKTPVAKKVGTRIEEGEVIDECFTFENFVKGKSNLLAHNTCQEIAKNLGRVKKGLDCGLCFLYGSSGLGKTHLMHAVAHRYQKAGLSYCYFTKDSFFRSAIGAMQGRGGADAWIKRIAKADLLLIDDVHMINETDGPKVSQILMVLLEEFSKPHKRLILASDRPPSQMKGFQSRFLSRFDGGLSIPIEPPDMETRIQILQKKATSMNMVLPKDCALFITQNMPPDVRRLEGALRQLQANALTVGGEINIKLVRFAIKDRIEARARVLNAENIRDVVAEYYGVLVKELVGKGRARQIARPRQVAMALTRELTQDSFPEIGQVFGGRDHTTVMHACEQITKLRQEDTELEKDYQSLKATLEFV